MQNLILNLFQKKFDCAHQNALINEHEGYCPDCGVFLKKYFYIIRCKHCEIKREGTKRFNSIYPKAKFCKNCGGEEFYIEKLEKISFIDIKYAIHTKETFEKCENTQGIFQIWVENSKKHPKIKLISKK